MNYEKFKKLMSGIKSNEKGKEVPVSKPVIIDPDKFKKQFNDFDPANHSKYSKMAKEEFNKELKINQNPTVNFTAGGSGSAKTEGIVKGLEKEGFDGIIYDGVMADFDSAIGKINQVIKADKRPIINVMLPNIKTSWKYVLKREKKTGRGVPLETFIEKHMGNVKTMIEILEKTNFRVKLKDIRKIFTKKGIFKQPFIEDRAIILDLFKNIRYNKSRLIEELKKIKL